MTGGYWEPGSLADREAYPCKPASRGTSARFTINKDLAAVLFRVDGKGPGLHKRMPLGSEASVLKEPTEVSYVNAATEVKGRSRFGLVPMAVALVAMLVGARLLAPGGLGSSAIRSQAARPTCNLNKGFKKKLNNIDVKLVKWGSGKVRNNSVVDLNVTGGSSLTRPTASATSTIAVASSSSTASAPFR